MLQSSPLSTIAPSTVKSKGWRPRHNRSSRRHFRDHRRAAVLRAITGAKLVIAGTVSSISEAAMCCGSNRAYVAAAIILLKAEDDHALDLVLRGVWPLLETAARLKPRANLVAAFRKTSSSDRAALGRVAGPDVMWDDCIAPII